MVITRIVPFSAAKIAAVVYACIGLVAGAMFSAAGLAGAVANPGQGGAFGGMLFGIGAIIVGPVVYACFGFFGTLLVTWIYNLVAGALGGVEVEVR